MIIKSKLEVKMALTLMTEVEKVKIIFLKTKKRLEIWKVKNVKKAPIPMD